MNEWKAVLKVSIQEGQSGAVNKTSVESMTQDDDFQEVKRHKRHISNNTLPTAKKSTKTVPTPAALKMPPKAVLTRKFFAPFKVTDMDTETAKAENKLLEQKAPKKAGRPPPIHVVMTSTANLIRL
jgi:hypothetical protein